MNTFNDIVKENGFLTTQGEQLVAEKLLPTIKELLTIAETDNQLLILGGILSNLIGKEVSNTIRDRAIVHQTIKKALDEGLQEFVATPARMTDPFDVPRNTPTTRQAIMNKVEEVLDTTHKKMLDEMMPIKTSSPDLLNEMLWNKMSSKKEEHK